MFGLSSTLLSLFPSICVESEQVLQVNAAKIGKVECHMNHDICSDDKDNSKRNFTDSDGTVYIFDAISGIYVPEPKADAQQRQKPRKKRKQEGVLEVKVRRDWMPVLVTLILGVSTVIVVGLYTYYTKLLWQATESSQRPWVGVIEEFTFTKPTFVVLPPVRTNRTGIKVGITAQVGLHNFGSSPALAENLYPSAYLAVSTEEATSKPPAVIFCLPTDTRVSSGEVIFTGVTVRANLDEDYTQYSLGKTLDIHALWIIGCSTYQDSHRIFHHTKFWFRSFTRERDKWVQLSPAVRIRPIDGFQLWDEEAD